MKTTKNKEYIPYGHQLVNDDDIRGVVNVLKSDFLTQGTKINEFEEKIAQYVGAKYAVAVCNGTAALHAACYAAGISQGDEAIVPTYSFVATANCVIYLGGKPALCDVYKDTLTIDVEKAQRKINKKTKAIIGVDFAGHPAEWEKLRQVANRNKLILIDDASHALGSTYRGNKIGSIADLTTFSFHPVKTITTGEGGVVTTNNRNYYERLLIFRNHGISKNFLNSKKIGSWFYDINDLGYNFRLTDLQASLGISQLRKIDKFIKIRHDLWEKYNNDFGNLKEIDLPIEKSYVKSAWHLYTLRLMDKKLLRHKRKIFDQLHADGIGVQTHYIPIHLHNYYQQKFGYQKGDCPVAENAYLSEMSLPLYPGLNTNEFEYVVKKLVNVIKKYS